ncbi:MAG TPA: twin-arginine translocation signal domain-containing protein, partial [Acidobacteriaceae bacterium]|nr:twin-arginine translocation signal domain-containing protein [Acidobacteriaceae bacterium]
MISRREFVGSVAAGVAGMAVSSTAKSYAQIMGANERVNFAIAGLNGRGGAHLSALKANSKDACISHVVDVDSTILDKFARK